MESYGSLWKAKYAVSPSPIFRRLATGLEVGVEPKMQLKEVADGV